MDNDLFKKTYSPKQDHREKDISSYNPDQGNADHTKPPPPPENELNDGESSHD